MPNLVRNRQKGYCVDRQYPNLSMSYFVDIAGPKADQVADFRAKAVKPPRMLIRNVPTFMVNDRNYNEAVIRCLVSADLGLECVVNEISGAFYCPETHVRYDKLSFLYPKYNHPRDLLDYMRDGNIVSVEAIPDPATHRPPKIPINLIEIIDTLKSPAPDARVLIQEDGLVRIYPHGLHRPELVIIDDPARQANPPAATAAATSGQGGSSQVAATAGTSGQGGTSQTTAAQGGSQQGSSSSTTNSQAAGPSQSTGSQAGGQGRSLRDAGTQASSSLNDTRSSVTTTVSVGSTGSSSIILGGVINNDDNNTAINRPQQGRTDTDGVFIPITTSTASSTQSAPSTAAPASAPLFPQQGQAPRTPTKTRRGRGLLVQTPSQPSMDDFVLRPPNLPSPIKHRPQDNILRRKRKAVYSDDIPPAQRASSGDGTQDAANDVSDAGDAGPSAGNNQDPRPGPSTAAADSGASAAASSGATANAPWPAPPAIPTTQAERPMAEAALTQAQPSPECCMEHVLVEVGHDGRYHQRLAIRRKHNPEDIVREFFQRTLSCSRNDEGIGLDATTQSMAAPAPPPTPQSSTETATTSMTAARGSSENLIIQISDTDDSIITVSSSSTTTDVSMDTSAPTDDASDNSQNQGEGERRGEKEKRERRGEKEKDHTN